MGVSKLGALADNSRRVQGGDLLAAEDLRCRQPSWSIAGSFSEAVEAEWRRSGDAARESQGGTGSRSIN